MCGGINFKQNARESLNLCSINYVLVEIFLWWILINAGRNKIKKCAGNFISNNYEVTKECVAVLTG